MQIIRACTAVAVLATAAVALPAVDLGILGFDQLAKAKLVGCNLSKAQLPQSNTMSTTTAKPLTPPTANLTLVHVALGRGTQNYTCSSPSASVAPVAIGAMARLYDASCVAALNPTLLHQFPPWLLSLTDEQETQISDRLDKIAGTNMLVAHHLFTPDAATPFFDFHTGIFGTVSHDQFVGVKAENVPAPSNSAPGKNGAVDWLRLTTKAGTVGGFTVGYRVETAGGKQSVTCANMPSHFEMPYAAEYWFYSPKDA